ncbi:hypothetical protein Taro_007155 [Colocasia esculenta]|uniref:Uncharacterized protein n=1 Tax=Colocasia esculenta TaxID=4460 RepID=A0A843TQN0_COLES|nr:hypothetical protein [Colocasia esculenta]
MTNGTNRSTDLRCHKEMTAQGEQPAQPKNNSREDDSTRRSQRCAPWQHNTIVEHHHPEQPTESRGSSQAHGQAHHTLTDNVQADCNTDSPTGNDDTSSPLRESSDDQSKHKAALGRTSAKMCQELSWENLTRTNEHRAFLRETLTRTTTNSSGKPHQNTGQPSDAPHPRGQRNNNRKWAQHSSGETSLSPEPIEKNSGSTSVELTTSQRQADNNHRQALQHSTSDATQHTGHLLRPSNNAD